MSIIIPAYNASPTIDRLLNALENQTYPKNKFEILIINDGSTDDTQSVVENWKLKNLRVFNQKNLGAGFARNVGIKHSRGKIIAFTDADCEPDEDWVQDVVDEIYVKRHVIVSGITYSNDVVVYPWRVSPAGQRRITANLALKKQTLNNIRFRIPHLEDSDFIFQLEDASSTNKVYFSDKMRVKHPIHILNLKQVSRLASRRYYDALLIKLNGKRAYDCMSFFYRPYLLNSLSLLSIMAIMFFISLALLRLDGLILDIFLTGLACILFIYKGYILTVKYGPADELNFSQRVTTLYYFIFYNLFCLSERAKGSIKYKKVVL